MERQGNVYIDLQGWRRLYEKLRRLFAYGDGKGVRGVTTLCPVLFLREECLFDHTLKKV
jgi:hypothetical protein